MGDNLDERDLVEAEFVDSEYIYGKGFTTGSPIKANILLAIKYLCDTYNLAFFPGDRNLDLTDLENWNEVEPEALIKDCVTLATSTAGRKGLLRVLDTQIRKLKADLKDKNDYLAEVMRVNKILRNTKSESKVASVAQQPTTSASLTRNANAELDEVSYRMRELLLENRFGSFNRSERNDKFYKIDGLPKFHGERKESLEQWIFQIDEALRTNNVPSDKSLGIITPLLKDNALQQYRLLYKSCFDNLDELLTWQVVKTKFRRVFRNDDEQRKLRNELRSLTNRANDDYDEYIKKFAYIQARIENLPESELLYSFIAGLSEKVRGEVLSKRPNSIDEA
jgi:hypothetical protein